MEKVTIDNVGRAVISGLVDRRSVSNALGATDMVIMYYEIEPGEPMSGGMHTHFNQEEIFYVLSGTATFDTEEYGTFDVEAGEIIRFAPGDFQHGYNDANSDESATVLAFGALPGMDDTVAIGECTNCGKRTHHDCDIPEDLPEGVQSEETITCQECENSVTLRPEQILRPGGLGGE